MYYYIIVKYIYRHDPINLIYNNIVKYMLSYTNTIYTCYYNNIVKYMLIRKSTILIYNIVLGLPSLITREVLKRKEHRRKNPTVLL